MGSGGREIAGGLLALVALAALVVAVPPATAGPASTADPLVYVSLGDSFTSGPLVLPHDTTFVPQDCGQSTRNYPHLVALLLGVDVLRDVSCGSAEIDHLAEPQDGLPLGGVNRPQLDALGPDVDVVTVGLGGNDVGFVGVATDCLRLARTPPLGRGPCHPSFVVDGVDRVSSRIAETQPELVAGLRAVQERAPNAAVLVVSYPTSLPDSGVGCWPYLPILPEDMPHLVAWFKEMNAMLEAAAEEAGATYVDIYTPSIGHDACQIPPVAWVNGVVLVPPSYPAHPNDLGFLGTAPTVAAAVRAALADDAAEEAAPGSGQVHDEPHPDGALGSPGGTTPTPAREPRPAMRRLPATGDGDSRAMVGSLALAAALVARRLGRAKSTVGPAG